MGISKRLIGAGATASSAITPSENFKVVTYTGNGSTTGPIVTVGFKPDKIWIKRRDSADAWYVYDSTRSTSNPRTKILLTNDSTAELDNTTYYSIDFLDNGFQPKSSLSTATNASGGEYVAYCWKANGGTTSSNTDGSITSTVQTNTDAGFSIATYTGTGSTGTYGHGLSSAPDLIITKRTDAVEGWLVYSSSLSASNYMYLNGTGAAGTDTNAYKTISATTNQIGSDVTVNTSGGDYIAYCFNSVDGFSKFGTYTGNGSDDGPIVETGFEPAYLMIKNTSIGTAGSYWAIYDNKRTPSNPRDTILRANSNSADFDLDSLDIDFLSNGFQVKGTYDAVNGNNYTYIYMAFAADPDTEAPTLASSFNVQTYTGTGSNRSIEGLGFSPSLLWLKGRSNTEHHYLYDTIRGSTKYLHSSNNAAQGTDSTSRLASFDDDGFSLFTDPAVNGSGQTYVAWAWKADDNEPTINENGSIDSIVSANANAGFSIVKWTGAGSNATIGHGLSAAPEMVIVKKLDAAQDWWVYHKDLNGGTNPAHYFIRLNLNNAETLNASSGGSIWNSTAPTSTVFSTGTTLQESSDYIAYCFHSVSGFSKFGTYTGTGSDGNAVTTGFQPDFLMVKRSDSTGGWLMFDSARSGSNPIDDRIEANNNQAEQLNSGSKYVDFNSNDFEANGSDSELNASGGTYIYMAYKMNPAPVVAEGKYSFLIVAGGASGGAFYGGGGGAGGLRTSFGSSSGGGASAMSEETLTSGTYTITVGAGGTSVLSSTYGRGNDGNTSSITGNSSLSTVGGGAGGTYVTNTTTLTGNSGGSGGGGGTLHQTSPYTSAGGSRYC